MMKIKITKGGIFNAAGKEIEVGTELDVKEEPKAWAGRYEVISGGTSGKTAVTNPAPVDPAKAELEAKTIPELKALAEAEKIDIHGATAKGDIIAHIMKAKG
jgi:hypothetical protein